MLILEKLEKMEKKMEKKIEKIKKTKTKTKTKTESKVETEIETEIEIETIEQNTTETDKIYNELIDDIYDYVYILQCAREILLSNNVHKIGKSKSTIASRFNGYEKGCRIEFIQIVRNAAEREGQIKKLFKICFKKIKKLGNEYYEGSLQDIIRK